MAEIDLSRLPAPDIIKQFTPDELLTFRLNYLKDQGVEIDNFTPSDPLYRNWLSNSYREQLIRDDANQQATSLLLAFAEGPALDHIGVTYHRVERLPDENDEFYRRRIQLSPEGSSVAGPEGKYIFEALSASNDVKDASFESPAPVQVSIRVLSKTGNGTPTQDLINLVQSRLMDDGVRPQTDLVAVSAPTITEYSITGKLKILAGPDSSNVHAEALAKLSAYTEKQHKLGGSVTLFGVNGALSVAGVENVELTGFSEITTTKAQAPYCTGINLTVEVI